MRALLACTAIAQHAEAGFAHCVCRVEPLHETAFVQRSHPDTSTPVLYLPEAHHDRSRSRHLERTSQPEHALPCPQLTEAGIARREHCPLDALEVQRRPLARWSAERLS